MTKGSFHFFSVQSDYYFFFPNLYAVLQSQLEECKNFIL